MKQYCSVIVFLLFCGLLYSPNLWAKSNLCQDTQVILDAGSTGTRAYLYQRDRSGPVGWHLSRHVDQEPGVSSDSTKVATARVNQLLEQLAITSETDCIMAIRIFATGGVRALNEQKKKELKYSLEQGLVGHGQVEFTILSGVEEGIYGWVAVNAAWGSLGKRHEETIGALDLGGASVQKAVAIDKKDSKQLKLSNVRIRLSGKIKMDYRLIVESLPLGQDRIRALTDSQLCIFPDDQVMGKERKSRLRSCDREIEKAIEILIKDSGGSVAQVKTKARNDIPEFWGIGAFGYARAEVYSKPMLLLSEYRLLTEKLCSSSWNKVRRQSKTPDKFLKEACFTGRLVTQLVQKFSASDDASLYLSVKQGKSIISWILGVVACANRCEIQVY